MGQSSSTQRDRRHISPRELSTRFHAGHDRDNRNEDMNYGEFDQTEGPRSSSGAGVNADGMRAFHSGNLRSTSEPWERPFSLSAEGAVPRQVRSVRVENGVQPDLQEYRSATFARMNARRQSTMSRLGSRILPNSVIRGLLNSEEETPAEGQAHRRGIVSRSVSRSEGTHSSGRFSPFGSLGSRGITRRRSTARAPYFIPRTDSALSSDPAYLDTASGRVSDSGRGSWRRSARLHRVRNSLSSPISQMFGHPSHQNPSSPPNPSASPAPGDSPNNTPPLPIAMDTRMDTEGPPHELDSVEPAVQNNNLTSSPGQGATDSRRLPSLLRPRSARVLRQEEQTPLSRVLQLAAAAIAAQLSGTTGPVMPNIQALGNGGQEGSLENFIQTLQSATSAQANPSGSSEGSSLQENVPPPPVNFLRVFRFSNSENSRRSEMPARRATDSDDTHSNEDRTDIDDPPEGNEGRTVTLVVVGVRSVPSGSSRGNDQPAETGPGLDALLGLPFLSPNNPQRNQESNGNRSNSRAGERPRVIPRPFTGGPGGLFANNDTLRQQGAADSSQRPSDSATGGGFSSSPSILSDSPPGPHPPPSTPAGSRLSGSSTPSRRLSTASVLPHFHDTQSMQPTAEPSEEEGVPLHRARQRRRSDSEYARHRDLGAGSVRRNGVVEPDNSGPTTGRSWLIYVVGTNVSENHPAFATPSLFTDNPTYEDMILLSSLLGPAKPPVATQSEVSSAGGLFHLSEYGGLLVAESSDGAGSIPIADGERCLICLSDYEVADELRQLNQCKHLYHRECIDQWLTTGRNSCPLCRGQGVNESSSNTGSLQGTAS